MRRPLAYLSFGLICVLIFARSWSYGLITGDDSFNITFNEFFHPSTFANLAGCWNTVYLKLYIPVTVTAWGLVNMATVALKLPSGTLFHVANTLVHWINSVLVFELIRKVLAASEPEEGKSPYRELIAALCTILFIVHPLQTTVVTWITGMKDLLSALFALAALHCLLHADVRISRKNHEHVLELGSVRWYAAATLAFVLALLSKPGVVVLPLLAGACYALTRKDWRAAVVATIPWLAAGAAIAFLTSGYQSDMIPGTRAPLWVRPFAALDGIAFYIQKLLFPHPLPHEYPRLIEVRRQSAPFWIWAGATGTLVAALWGARHRVPRFCGGLFFALCGLVPVLGFVTYTHQQFCDVANHYMYVPMIGVSLSLAFALDSLDGPLALTATSMLLTGLSALSYHDVALFAGDEAFYGEVLRYDPDNYLANLNLASWLEHHGQFERAYELARHNLDIHPDYPAPVNQLAMIQLLRRQPDEAVRLLQEFARLIGDAPQIHLAIGCARIITGSIDEGIRELLRAEQMSPLAVQMPPADFIIEFLKIRPSHYPALENLRHARSLNGRFRSVWLLIDQLEHTTDPD